jgi:hypothetical protein
MPIEHPVNRATAYRRGRYVFSRSARTIFPSGRKGPALDAMVRAK